VGAVLLLALGVVMLGPAFAERFTAVFSGVASAANQATGRFDTASVGGAMVTGALLGLIWSHCSGPLLAAALTLVATEGGVARVH
jgi:cytochrome c biogenesis protein CcdA